MLWGHKTEGAHPGQGHGEDSWSNDTGAERGRLSRRITQSWREGRHTTVKGNIRS